MSSRKTSTHEPAKAPTSSMPTPRPRKKPRVSRVPRVRLTHFEVRRGENVRLRIAVADEALGEIGDELSALIKRIAPSTAAVAQARAEVTSESEIVVPREHLEQDAVYHDELREYLAAFFSSLCDPALDDALDAARKERDRRADGGN